MSLRLGFYASLMSFANLLGFCLSEKLESFQKCYDDVVNIFLS